PTGIAESDALRVERGAAASVSFSLLSGKSGQLFVGQFDERERLVSKGHLLYGARQPIEGGAVHHGQAAMEAGAALMVAFVCGDKDVELVGGVLSNFRELSDIRRALPECEFHLRRL